MNSTVLPPTSALCHWLSGVGKHRHFCCPAAGSPCCWFPSVVPMAWLTIQSSCHGYSCSAESSGSGTLLRSDRHIKSVGRVLSFASQPASDSLSRGIVFIWAITWVVATAADIAIGCVYLSVTNQCSASAGTHLEYIVHHCWASMPSDYQPSIRPHHNPSYQLSSHGCSHVIEGVWNAFGISIWIHSHRLHSHLWYMGVACILLVAKGASEWSFITGHQHELECYTITHLRIWMI